MTDKSLEERYHQALRLVAELEETLSAQRREGENVFLNFHDLRSTKAVEETQKVLNDVTSRIPAGERVTLVMSKSDFGRISIPLNMAAAEMIS